MKQEISNDAWIVITKFCHVETLIQMFHVNKFLRRITTEVLTQKEWSNFQMWQLIRSKNHTLVTSIVKNKRKIVEINILFEYACHYGNLSLVEYLLKFEKLDIGWQFNRPLLAASKNGFVDIVSLLLKDKRMNPNSWEVLFDDEKNYKRYWLNKNKHLPLMKMIWDDDNIGMEIFDNEALVAACENNHLDIVLLFLSNEQVNPDGWENYAKK